MFDWRWCSLVPPFARLMVLEVGEADTHTHIYIYIYIIYIYMHIFVGFTYRLLMIYCILVLDVHAIELWGP